jgi:aminopeptidase N
MLSESFASYSALLVMEKIYGPEQVRKFLNQERDRYLQGRLFESVGEQPLYRVENQAYIHYNKGAMILYRLKTEMGAEVVNGAMKRMVELYKYKSDPYPRSTDFLRILREAVGPQHDALITDLFEKITLLDMKARNAKSVKRADGKYELSFEVEGKKLYADGKGKETEAPLDEAFDIGVFDAEPGKAGFNAKSVLLFERRGFKTGRQTVTVVVDREPRWVGVDPYNKRIDRNSDDNLARVGSD